MTIGATTARFGDARVIGLVSGGHFFSHFYGLALPPLFPLLKAEFGVGYAALGLLVSVMSLASGIAQVPVGFLVDRFGAARFLILGITVQASATLLMGLAPSYWVLLAFMVMAGLGNCVYHPADYAILSATVRHERLGRAFSVHTFAGHVGWALAPAVIGALATVIGWRAGLVAVGSVGLVAAMVIAINRGGLRSTPASGGEVTPGQAGIRLLLSSPIVMCFLFYVLIATGSGGFYNFLVSALVAGFDTPFAAATAGLTAFFMGSASGILVGGVLADRTARYGTIAVVGFGASSLLISIIGAVGLAPVPLLGVLALAGFANGLVPPSRDLMVRSVTPPGATGRVFAFVSVGFDVGGVATPLVYGWIMDTGDVRWVFWLTALLQLVAIVTVLGARRGAVQVASRPG